MLVIVYFIFIWVPVTWVVPFCVCIFYISIKLNNGPKLACQYSLEFMDISASRQKIPDLNPWHVEKYLRVLVAYSFGLII